MELRRALLLFAIVLGLAAIVSSVARAPDREDRAPEQPSRPDSSSGPSRPTAGAQPAPRRAAKIRFVVGSSRKTETLKATTAATVSVSVDEPGQVSIDGLGLTAHADPMAPARFDVLSTRPGRYPVRFRALPDQASRPLGFLQVVPAPLP